MRAILHDWPDHLAGPILGKLKLAMSVHSTILVDDRIVPETDAYANVTSLDLDMMCSLGALERTQAQWETLFAAEGLKLEEVFMYKVGTHEGVMKVVPM